MRKAALIAGAVQLLYAVFIVAPQVFGTSFFASPTQTAFRSFTVIGCLTLVTFFFGIVMMPAPNVGGAIKIVAVLAAAALTIENLPYAISTIRGTAPYINETALWKFHPIRQIAYVLGSTLPLISGITLVVFLFAVFARAQKPKYAIPNAQGQTEFLRLASFTVAAVFAVGLAGTIFAVAVTRPFTASALRLLLRFATLVSFVAFFFVFGLNQHRQNRNHAS
jgi:hypothetical protein